MLGKTKSLKISNRKHREILIVPSMFPRFLLRRSRFRFCIFHPYSKSYGRLYELISRRGWQADQRTFPCNGSESEWLGSVQRKQLNPEPHAKGEVVATCTTVPSTLASMFPLVKSRAPDATDANPYASSANRFCGRSHPVFNSSAVAPVPAASVFSPLASPALPCLAWERATQTVIAWSKTKLPGDEQRCHKTGR